MSEGGDTFWVSLSERFLGLLLIIIGGIMIYLTATSTDTIGDFSAFFGFLSLILLIIGILLLIVKPPQ
jgi:hypothetical protein